MKTVIITGGNNGLGLYCAKNIAKHNDWKIIIASSNVQKSEAVVNKIIAETGNHNVGFYELDLADLQSVKNFVNKITDLDALVNNAGVQYITAPTRKTKQGIEATFGINYLGHFLLTYLLLNKMNKECRIINVSSFVHHPDAKTRMSPPNYTTAKQLAFPNDLDIIDRIKTGTERYSTSKLCNAMFSYSLAEYISQNNLPIFVNSFDPGMMPGTGLADDYNSLQKFAWKYIFPAFSLFKRGVNMPTTSGKNLATLITDTKFSAITGKYFIEKSVADSSEESKDLVKQKDLWDTSLELCKFFMT